MPRSGRQGRGRAWRADTEGGRAGEVLGAGSRQVDMIREDGDRLGWARRIAKWCYVVRRDASPSPDCRDGILS